MICVIGNKQKEINAEDFELMAKRFDEAVLDIGTGDGRFVYKNALKNKGTLFIGMDSAQKQMEVYSKKAVRKKLDNVLFVVGSAETVPPELFGVINKIFITLPWGTLLERIVKGDSNFLKNLQKLLKKYGSLEIIFGYLPELEPSETKRLGLPQIDLEFVEKKVIPMFESFGFQRQKEHLTKVNKSDLRKVETTWARKLIFGKEREMYKINLSKQEN